MLASEIRWAGLLGSQPYGVCATPVQSQVPGRWGTRDDCWPQCLKQQLLSRELWCSGLQSKRPQTWHSVYTPRLGIRKSSLLQNCPRGQSADPRKASSSPRQVGRNQASPLNGVAQIHRSPLMPSLLCPAMSSQMCSVAQGSEVATGTESLMLGIRHLRWELQCDLRCITSRPGA